MARPSNLSLMSIDALFKLRDDVSAALSRKTDELKSQLLRLTGGGGTVGNGKLSVKRRSTKGKKVAPKYRDPATGDTWAARGATPRWLVARLKQGKKLADFLIDKPSRVAASRKTSAAKKSRRKKK
jgi:DNA-binding protein H-NS